MNRTQQLRLFCLLKIHKSEIYIKKENATYNLYAALPKDFSEKWKSDFRFEFLNENVPMHFCVISTIPQTGTLVPPSGKK